ncbi:hypothetical protein LX36DRAFT_63438 [Colletotrichum falcatum]|nr:hypothetical protein LX36DRAFT_63438 [Colletotrichum falcatum]
MGSWGWHRATLTALCFHLSLFCPHNSHPPPLSPSHKIRVSENSMHTHSNAYRRQGQARGDFHRPPADAPLVPPLWWFLEWL